MFLLINNKKITSHQQSFLLVSICVLPLSTDHRYASYLIQSGILGHLGQGFPDDEHFRTLLSNLKLMEPDGQQESSGKATLTNKSILLLVTDVVCDILNEEQNCSPGWSMIKLCTNLFDFTLVCCKLSKPPPWLLPGPPEQDSQESRSFGFNVEIWQRRNRTDEHVYIHL